MKSVIQLVLSYVVHLALTAIAAWGLAHGFHISVPVLPSSLSLFAFTLFIRHLGLNISHAWRSGTLLAEAESDGKTIIQQLINAAEGKTAAPKAAGK